MEQVRIGSCEKEYHAVHTIVSSWDSIVCSYPSSVTVCGQP